MLYLKKIKSSDSRGEEVEGGGADEEVSIERMLAAGISRGLTMQDTESMTLGMWVDYIIEWNNMNAEDQNRYDEKGNKTVTRHASQADFDVF